MRRIQTKRAALKFLSELDMHPKHVEINRSACIFTHAGRKLVLKNIPEFADRCVQLLRHTSLIPKIEYYEDGIMLQEFVERDRIEPDKEDARVMGRMLSEYHILSESPNEADRLGHLNMCKDNILAKRGKFGSFLATHLYPQLVDYQPASYSFVHGDPWGENWILSDNTKIIDYEMSHSNLNGFDLSYVQGCWPHFFEIILEEYSKHHDVSEFLSKEGGWYSEACCYFSKYSCVSKKYKPHIEHRLRKVLLKRGKVF